MNVFLIAAQSLDGFIALDPKVPSTTWTSKADKDRFVTLTKKAGVVIMGLNTFKTIGKPLKDRRTIVYSPEPIENIETTTLSPKELINKLEQEGYTEVAVCGGASIYTMFAKAKVLDTIYLTIEPIFFGSGIKLFTEPVSLNLHLQEESKVGDTMLVTYTIIP